MTDQTTKKKAPPPNQGVRKLKIKDQLPDCEVWVNKRAYELTNLVSGKHVVDIGCGYGRNRPIVENLGGTWVGVEPFEGGAHTVVADAEDLPFKDGEFDVAIMDAVLEHIPDVGKAFGEVARILKPGGLFVGYVAFMECFHEISYSHLSFKAMEHYAKINHMKLERIAGATRFGLDYNLAVLMSPIPFRFTRGFIASCIRGFIKLKSKLATLAIRIKRKLSKEDAQKLGKDYYILECMRQSQGFTFVVRKL